MQITYVKGWGDKKHVMKTVGRPDTDSIVFKASIRLVKYGDGHSFAEYTVLMFHRDRLVGIENGPRRETILRSEATKSARKRIAILRTRRLFVVRVTRKHITNGEARNCNTCAIAQALWHNQERMGLDRREFSFEVSPYGAFTDPRGIVLRPSYGDGPELHVPVMELPKMAIGIFNKRPYSESMQEWAMAFDDWAEYRFMSASDWREERSEDLPYRPNPCAFVFDADALKEMTA